MRIKHLRIENFRGIRVLDTGTLGDTIIIAGQNGSGKSCIFDAIRLIKSIYGGYQQNEWQQFFGEFQIQLGPGQQNLKGLFNDISKPCLIKATFALREREKAYITANAAELLEETIWQTELPEAFQFGYRQALFAAQFREKRPDVLKRVQDELPILLAELNSESVEGTVSIQPNGNYGLSQSRLLSLVFSTYRPRNIGVIDFHGAQRHYGRELVQGINLNLEQNTNNYRQSSLYNYNNKYNNVKSEMAGNFVKELLAESADDQTNPDEPKGLTDTLKELFESFFPDKKFLGPQPTKQGSLEFPVVTQSGSVHDLDELSAGEKEILYGYLRIRSSAPRDSIILLDEPELHLNPRLIRGLPEFYRKHLGEALQNQLWLVTHSDALIREAIGKPGFNVFHMLPCGSASTQESQLHPISVTGDLDTVLADLVGDLAAYRPGGKGVIFEGGGDTDFDKYMAGALFSEELKGINLLSGSNKARVRQLHEILDRAYKAGDLPTKFYAITDHDSDAAYEPSEGLGRFQWDAYHIENYLIQDSVILEVIKNLSLDNQYGLSDIQELLESSARDVIPSVVLGRIQTFVHDEVFKNTKIRIGGDVPDVVAELVSGISAASANLQKAIEGTLSENVIREKNTQFESQLNNDLSSGDWRKTFPGRSILRRFVARSGVSVKYPTFRNLILSRMVEEGIKPSGMKSIIDAISSD